MKAVVVYESMFGNTRKVAEAIAVGLEDSGTVTVVPVGSADYEVIADADLVVVGGPTHVHGMSRPTTRTEAERMATEPESTLTLEPNSTAVGVREWIEAAGPLPRLYAAFDTRADAFKWLTGSAARDISRKMRGGKRREVVPAATFLAPDNDTDLSEIDRAREWGRAVGHATLEVLGFPASLRG